MELRRADDQTIRVLMAEAARAIEAPLPLREYTGGEQEPARPVSDEVFQPDGRHLALVLDGGGPDVILFAGLGVGRLSKGEGGTDLLARAAAGAQAWCRESARERRRLDLAENLMMFADRLNTATTVSEVREALTVYAVQTVGAYAALLFTAEPEQEGLSLVASSRPWGGALRIHPHPSLVRSGIITSPDLEPDTGSPLSGLAPLLSGTRAATVAHIPVTGGVLFLVERRADRVFQPDDWHVLQMLVRQTETALERIRLFEDIRELSLTDPLTGLSNRRQMDAVLRRSLAAARRGEDLSLIILDIDDFKAVNDQNGHLAGDRILARVAECLRDMIRGCDEAVRFGGDEFILILPGTSLAGAQVLVTRIRKQLGDGIQISAGAAQYDASMRGPDDLIAAADRELFVDKNARKAAR